MKKLLLIVISLLLITNAEASMKIKKIEATDLGIVVTLEEYPHAQPVFPADTTAEELPNLLKAWKVNQDAVDAENEARKANPPATPEVSEELKALEETEIKEDL